MLAYQIINKIHRDGFYGLLKSIYYKTRERIVSEFIRTLSDPIPLLTTRHIFRRLVNPSRWTDAEPFKLIQVNPGEIKRVSPLGRPLRFGEVRDGDWWYDCEKFSSLPTFSSLHSHFIDGVPLDDTNLHDMFIKEMESGGGWGHSSVSEWSDRIAAIHYLADQIRSNGYKSQRKLLNESELSARDANNDALHPLLNEIKVDIGPTGEFLWRHSAQHRLSLAKMYNIETVPVLVVTRHRRWEKIRNNMKELSDIGQVKHPDLENMIMTEN